MANRPRAQGQSGAEAKAYAAESSTAVLRLAVILFGLALYWGAYFPSEGPGIPALAVFVTVASLAYAVFDVLARPYERWPILLTSTWTAITDGVLITLWLHATGDVRSPFFPLWYVSLVGVAFRFNWRATILAGVLYVTAYTLLVAMTGGLPGAWLELALRNGYLLLLAVLAAVLARATARAFDERFQLGLEVQQATRFRALAEATPDPVLVSRDGTILEVNRALCELVHSDRAALLGKSAVDFVDPASVEQVRQRLRHPSDEPYDVWIKDLGEGRRLIRLYARDIDWEGRPARVVSLRDITKEREAEDARRHAMEVEMEVSRLREMDRFKGEFINAAAHELNTPLTPLKLELHVLRYRLADAPEAQRHSLDLLDRNLNRLAALVQDMLDVARLQSGRLRLDPQPCDMARLVQEAAETFANTARQRGIELGAKVPGPLPLIADTKRVGQILDNLLSNALKFTPAKGHVAVTARQDAGHVEVEVADDGAGLTPEQAQRLFHPFVQVHRDKVMAPGTGLGLYISRGIAERHDGTLTCRSDGPGKGATFTLRLPAVGPAVANP